MAQITLNSSGVASNGTLALQSNGTTTAVTIDTSQNVGIGTASPSKRLQLGNNATTSEMIRFANTTANFDVGMTTSGCEITTVNNQPIIFTNNAAERMRIDSSGNVLVTNVAGLGYGTGSGGTVTQATSKTTGVTLNKPTGQITTNNAALAAGASVQFIMTNSLVAAGDLVIAHCGNNANYAVQVLTTLSTQVYIRYTNITGGSLSEAFIINFAVIKGATS